MTKYIVSWLLMISDLDLPSMCVRAKVYIISWLLTTSDLVKTNCLESKISDSEGGLKVFCRGYSSDSKNFSNTAWTKFPLIDYSNSQFEGRIATCKGHSFMASYCTKFSSIDYSNSQCKGKIAMCKGYSFMVSYCTKFSSIDYSNSQCEGKIATFQCNEFSLDSKTIPGHIYCNFTSPHLLIPKKITTCTPCTRSDSDCYKEITYSVGWIQWLGDIKHGFVNWKLQYYDPAEIDGVGIVMGIFNGKLYGSQLKSHTCEEIIMHSDGHYSWIFDPKERNITYVRNSKEKIENKDYIRHSQLNKGNPVLCAGEFYIKHIKLGYSYKLFVDINDSSGHYKPDGRACIPPVIEKFQELGIHASSDIAFFCRDIDIIGEVSLLEES
ncbi:hypothetical protein [Candidatus Tisiphia endosymbiont of Oplodontha viridula]|uniref:hypothetical protein n=1 Tax=Candidatus Tisiphia endosymbiont of Oplodontha viridula TaxID=3077925 RepID=UPI0035C8EF22